MDALAAEALEVLKDAADAGHAVFGSFNMHGVGAKIDADAERVFDQSEVFIAGPKQGLEVGRDLQSDLQRVLCPPGRWVAVNVDRQQRNKAEVACIVEMQLEVIVAGARSTESEDGRRKGARRHDCTQAADFDGSRRARGRRKSIFRAALRDRGLGSCTKSSIARVARVARRVNLRYITFDAAVV